MPYAEETSVSVEKTRAELERLLRDYNADAFGSMHDNTRAAITFKMAGRAVRFVLPLPDASEKRFTEYKRGSCAYRRSPDQARKEWEQACRSCWRALFLAVKAKLVAIERRISTFDNEFMAHIILPDGSTVSENIGPMIERSYQDGKMPNFTLALPDRR